MFRLAAIVFFALSVIFNAWTIGHGIWTWELFALLGALCFAISHRWDV